MVKKLYSFEPTFFLGILSFADLLKTQKVARDTINCTSFLFDVLPSSHMAFYPLHGQQIYYIVLNLAKLLTSTMAKKH